MDGRRDIHRVHQLRSDHLRELLQIFGETSELAGDRDVQLAHALDRLRHLIGGAVTGEFDIRQGQVIRSVDRGWTSEADLRRMYSFYAQHGFDANPFSARVFAIRPVDVTARREDLLCDQDWYGSAFYTEVQQPARLDDAIYSVYADSYGVVHAMGICRAAGENRFDADERALVHAFHRELLPLLPGAPDPLAQARLRLTPRQKETLVALLAGMSDKEIAKQLGISPYTVAQYAKAIYRAFDVAGRTELLALHIGSH